MEVLLADVGKLIEKDEELSQVEFVQNVLDAYSVDGKLYYVIPNFRVSTPHTYYKNHIPLR